MIDEAIDYLGLIFSDRKDDGVGDDMPGQKAIQLGIEALERLQDLRQRAMAMYSDHISKLLPSETEENQ